MRILYALALTLLTLSAHAQIANPVGVWGGVMPCADCQGIKYTLQVLSDSTYKETQVYLGKSDKEFDQLGTWKLVQDSILLLRKADPGLDRFVLGGGTLTMVDPDNRRVEGSTAAMYVLRPTTIEQKAEEPAVVEEPLFTSREDRLRKAGVDYLAEGPKPEWSLEVDEGNQMRLRLGKAAPLKFTAPMIKRAADAKMYAYRGTSKGGGVVASIVVNGCKAKGGDMPDAVTVAYKGKAYKGCGRSLKEEVAAVLTGKWQLDSLNGATAPTAPKESMHLIFEDGQNFSGSTGCNRIRGGYVQDGDRLTLRAPVMTRMACQGYDEGAITTMMEQVKTFKMQGNKLSLMGEAGVIAVFSKNL